MSKQFEGMPAERLNEGDAHAEANMMRYSVEKLGKEATAEDYDEAMKALEELKALAAEGPSGADKIKKYLTQIVVAGTFPIALLGGIINETISLNGKGYVAEVKDDVDFLTSYFTKGGVAWTEAERRLEVLKYEAERKATEEKL